MFAFSLIFPTIDPVALQLGPFAIRWYGISYVLGIFFGWRWILKTIKDTFIFKNFSEKDLESILTPVILGIILGGRLGYMLFYIPFEWLDEPLRFFKIWEGGMSFHGGLLGCTAALWWTARKQSWPPLALFDLIACAAPLGLFFGRIANFINGELYGRITSAPWGIIFPGAGPLGRHPSQIYEAILEGLGLFLLINLSCRLSSFFQKRPGSLSGLFLIGYGMSRIFVEFFREPDAHIGYFLDIFTWGQFLSFPFLLIGFWMIFREKKCS